MVKSNMTSGLTRAFVLIIGLIFVLTIGRVGAQAFVQGNLRENVSSSGDSFRVDEGESSSSSPVRATPVISETILMPVLLLQPTPTTASSPTPTMPSQAPWLVYLNQFRTSTGLEPLDANDDWSQGGWLHSRYMVKNDYVGHSEDPGNPWYTPDGLAAAQNGNVFVASWDNAADETPIDFWMTAPFHAISMLDPQLHTTGFGIYREAVGLWKTGSTLDVRRGRGSLPPGTAFPIPYPADGGTTNLTTYFGNEFPDPLTSCPGYIPPTGSPIMLQLGSGDITPQVSSHQLWENGIPVESCRFDETDYINPDPGMQTSGRIILNIRDAVVIMPKDPLDAGKTYLVEVSTADGTTTWSFTVPLSHYSTPGLESAAFQIDSIAKPHQ